MANRIKFFKNENGNIAVEFSMVAVPMLLFILGAVETSRFLWAHTALQNVATSTARCVGLRALDCSSDQKTVNIISTRELILANASAFGIDLSNSEISISGNEICHGIQDYSEVTITYNFPNAFTLYEDKELDISACFPNQKIN